MTFTQLSKIVKHFKTEVADYAFWHTCNLFNNRPTKKLYFYQSFCIKRTEIWNKTQFPIGNFKVASHLTSRVRAGWSSIFAIIDSYLKYTEYLFFLLFDPRCISRDICPVRSFCYIMYIEPLKKNVLITEV